MEISLKKSQIVRFESVRNGLGGRKIIRGATKHGPRGSNAKTKNIYDEGRERLKKLTCPILAQFGQVWAYLNGTGPLIMYI